MTVEEFFTEIERKADENESLSKGEVDFLIVATRELKIKYGLGLYLRNEYERGQYS